jgi:hypothetical protein
MSYFPVTPNRSGEILAAGQMQSAETNANMMNKLGSDIGGALASIGGMYGEIEGQKAKGRAFKDVFKVVSPSLGISMEQLEAVSGGKLKNDRDWFQASEMLMPMMPALINAQLGRQRVGVQQAQPYVNAGLQNAGNLAAGEGTVPLPNNPPPYGGVVEPPLPEGDPAGAETLPPVRTSTPSPDAMSAADSWWKNKSSGSPMQSGSMKPFWR